MVSMDSPLLEIRTTQYGGRGYFAVQDIPADTAVLRCRTPFISVVYRRFKKEVCAFCFAYDRGRNLKFKLEAGLSAKQQGPAYAGVYFCSETCRHDWTHFYDDDGLLSATFQALEISDRIRAKKARSKDPVSEDQSGDLHNYSHDSVDRAQDQDHQDFGHNSNNNRNKTIFDAEKLNRIWSELESSISRDLTTSTAISLDDVEMDFARLVAFATVQKTRGLWATSMFDQLQSNEIQQLNQFPSLLHSHHRIYRFLQTSLPKEVASHFSSDVLRSVLGREAGNAFGIWEQPLTAESECFGTAVYPEASFFNHYCASEVTKSRQGPRMLFSTRDRPILAGQELHISYGMIENLPYDKRQRILQDQWHFTCLCPKCIARE